MRAIIGTVIVVGSVLGGYLPHGSLGILIQPLEVLIIIGATIGAYVIATPGSLIKEGVTKSIKLAKGSHHGKQDYLELSKYLFRIFNQSKRQGMMTLEPVLEAGLENPLLADLEKLKHNSPLVTFVHDYLSMAISGVTDAEQLDSLMEAEIRMRIKHAAEPAKAIGEAAQALPAFGIVAAVLGIIVTMSYIDAGPVEIAHHMSVALVGTFMGILVAYGFVAPIAHALEHDAKADGEMYTVARTVFVGSFKGYAPQIACDFGRKMIPDAIRPDANEFEEFLVG